MGPYPIVDFNTDVNPIPTILADRHFLPLAELLKLTPGGRESLQPPEALALLYTIVRNIWPETVVEIGTFKGGTAEIISRALAANQRGTLYTVGPFDSAQFLPFFETWPSQLQSRVEFYPIDSMAFYMRMDQLNIRPAVVFVDGNHDFEFALFDIQCAARRLRPGGFIVADNVSQAGPHYAALEFAGANQDWVVCGGKRRSESGRAFDPDRSAIAGTDFTILRAPNWYVVGGRPKTFGEVAWSGGRVKGVRLQLAQPASGIIYMQVVLRGFGQEHRFERAKEVSRAIIARETQLMLAFEEPLIIEEACSSFRVEPWFAWHGEGTLKLAEMPHVM